MNAVFKTEEDQKYAGLTTAALAGAGERTDLKEDLELPAVDNGTAAKGCVSPR
jgi:hypothetical protein